MIKKLFHFGIFLLILSFYSCSPISQDDKSSKSQKISSESEANAYAIRDGFKQITTTVEYPGTANTSSSSITSSSSTSHDNESEGETDGNTNTYEKDTNSSSDSNNSSTDTEDDEESDDEDDEDLNSYYYDGDGDGQGDPNTVIKAASRPDGYVSNSIDCDDDDETIYAGATEVCGDGVDSDCDGLDPETLYPDIDEDGYGDPNGEALEATPTTCLLSKVSIDNTDCDDSDELRNPKTSWYQDADGDGYGEKGGDVIYTQCEDPSTSQIFFSREATDCDDTKIYIHPDSSYKTCGINADCDDSTESSNCKIVATEISEESNESSEEGATVSVQCEEGFVMTGCTCYDARQSCAGGSYIEIDSEGVASCNAHNALGSSVTVKAQCLQLGTEEDTNFILDKFELDIAMSEPTGEVDDDSNAISCEDGFTMISCSCYSDENACGDGAKMTERNLCTAYADGGGGSVQAVATCLNLGENYTLSTEIKTGATSGNADDDTSTTSCSEGYTLTGCSCYTAYGLCDDGAQFKDSNSCVAYRDGTANSDQESQGVSSYAVCLKVE